MWHNRKNEKNAAKLFEVISVEDDLEKLRATLQNISNKYQGRIVSVTWSPTARAHKDPPISGFLIVIEFEK
jgi:hypothetical protein